MFKLTVSAITKINNILAERIQQSGAPYFVFGIFGIINNPISFLYWQYLYPDDLPNLYLRVVTTLFCLALILKNKWPKRLQVYFPLYWYISILYTLPFFGSYMLLRYSISTDWLMNMSLGMFLLILIVDWISFIALLILGTVLGVLSYLLINGDVSHITTNSVISAFYLYSFALLIGGLFSQRSYQTYQSQLKAAKILAADIAHELRTPLASMRMGVSGLKKLIPTLIRSYELSKSHRLAIPTLRRRQLDALRSFPERSERELTAANTFIDMMLMKVKNGGLKEYDIHHSIEINDCIEEAIQRYPFKSDSQRELIVWQKSTEFKITADRFHIIHILFNLIKNSIFYIEAEQKGHITIWTESNKKTNAMHFKDTAKGASKEAVSKLFDPFVTSREGGAGLGLAFIKAVMESIGGEIQVQAEDGEYMHFTLYFPKVSGDKLIPVIRTSIL